MDLDMKHFVSTFEIRKLETGMVKRRLFWRLRAISSFRAGEASIFFAPDKLRWTIDSGRL